MGILCTVGTSKVFLDCAIKPENDLRLYNGQTFVNANSTLLLVCCNVASLMALAITPGPQKYVYDGVRIFFFQMGCGTGLTPTLVLSWAVLPGRY